MGERTLVGAERRLVVRAGWGLADFISAEAPENKALFGIVLFDQLTWQQQMLMLERALTALVEPTIPAPPSTALLDATVAAIYAQLQASVEIELDEAKTDLDSSLGEEDYFEVRQEILEAMREPVDSDEPMEESPEGGWPTILCDEIDEWELAIESLRGRILADEDWQMEAITIDLARRSSTLVGWEQHKPRIDYASDMIDEPFRAVRITGQNKQ